MSTGEIVAISPVSIQTGVQILFSILHVTCIACIFWASGSVVSRKDIQTLQILNLATLYSPSRLHTTESLSYVSFNLESIQKNIEMFCQSLKIILTW